jgi:RsiW-degrading membrane proteinase PrsW (M82 family)
MQPHVGFTSSSVQVAPAYPAELVIPSRGWISRLARNGIVYLDRPEVHLGLLATNDVVFRDPHVSRLHAVIRWTPAGYEIEDLNSTWGTYVQGQRVVGRMPLPPGALIKIGTLDIRFQPVPLPPPLSSCASQILPGYPAQPSSPAAATTLPQRGRAVGLRAWLRRQAPKRYWRVFLLGLLAYVAADLLVNLDLNLHAIPLVILLASALVPITFVVYCYEEGAFADMPATVVGLTFVSGAVMGLLVAGFLEDLFLVDIPVLGALMVGVIEEGAKAAAVIWFLRDKRLRSELDGLVLGAAAGMGFATLESAGYGFNGFLAGYTNALAAHVPANSGALDHAISSGITLMTIVLVVRMILAVFGHGVWTAIVCAAIWRERGPAVLRITGGVVLAFFIAVTLHALWDSVGIGLSLLLWPMVAFSGLWVLRFFIHEAVDRAKLGLYAPPPAPLTDALGAYLRHPFRRPTLRPVALARPPAPTHAGMPVGIWPASYPPSYPPSYPAPHAGPAYSPLAHEPPVASHTSWSVASPQAEIPEQRGGDPGEGEG